LRTLGFMPYFTTRRLAHSGRLPHIPFSQRALPDSLGEPQPTA
jgi:hypothetical protein